MPPDVVPTATTGWSSCIEQTAWKRTEAVGTIVEVLVADGEGRKDAATRRLSGRARDNRLVHLVPYAPAADGSDLLLCAIREPVRPELARPRPEAR